MVRYEYLDHTGDLGLRAYGETPAALFTNAAMGLLETVADLDTIEAVIQIEIEVSADSVENLLVAWLGELIFRHEVDEVLFRQVEIQEISESPSTLSAVVYGEPMGFTKHVVYTEIKSVTYHQLLVEQNPDGSWVAQVIFDL
jgi:SHS2 domain-containing protein